MRLLEDSMWRMWYQAVTFVTAAQDAYTTSRREAQVVG